MPLGVLRDRNYPLEHVAQGRGTGVAQSVGVLREKLAAGLGTRFAWPVAMSSPRLATVACLLLMLGGSAFAGCGNSASSSGTSGTAGGAGVGSGGTSVGGAGASGSSFGGSAAGTVSSGGSSAGAAGGCHTAADCPMNNTGAYGLPQCLPPGQTPQPQQYGCGAPGWCGKCGCPLLPPGNGQPCQTDTECPAAAAGSASASHCFNGACAQCATSADCPAAAPVCASMLSISMQVRMCTACVADTDCPSGVPHCASGPGLNSCVACVATSGCASGVCSGGACVPECGPNKPCANPLTECTPTLRCEALSCTASATCPANTACVQGRCQRRACGKDSECDHGACVGSFCYESLGSCFSTPLYPSTAG